MGKMDTEELLKKFDHAILEVSIEELCCVSKQYNVAVDFGEF
jgi:hypothetical protein